jgi:uncharacterized protein (TIGR02117 family)
MFMRAFYHESGMVVGNLWRGLRWLAAALAGLVLVYAVAGVVGGAMPVNREWRSPARGIRVWLIDNGVHTDLVLPADALGIDWRRIARPTDLADPRYGGWGWVAIGWGDRRFYLETPEWQDVRPATVLAAAVGSEHTVLHVAYSPEPRAGAHPHAVTLRPEEYRRLAGFVRGSFRIEQGRLRHWHGYDAFDAFYDARGHYSAIRTCNAWVGAALRAAGVRVGWWTPFPVTVMGWF